MQAINFPGMRNVNRSIVLTLIRDHGPISRGDIAKQSRLAPSAVSNIVTELISLGLVSDSHVAKSEGGRPATLLKLNPSSAFALGAHIGLDQVTVIVANLTGGMEAKVSSPIGEADDPRVVLQRLVACAQEGVAKARIRLDQVMGLGVGVPGLIARNSGTSVFSPNLGWRNVPVKAWLEEMVGMPVYVDNDVRLATLGEREYGAGDQARFLVALYVGSAIGAGLVLDGRLYYGAGDAAGEVGHVQVREDGPLCPCGNRGCLEAVASGRAIAEKARAFMRQGASFTHLKNMNPEKIEAVHVGEAARSGDEVAAKIIKGAARHVGRAVLFLVNTYNPEIVVISGGVAEAGELFFGPIKEMVRQHAMPVAREGVRIVPGRLGSDAGPLGAAALVMQHLFPPIHLGQSDLIVKSDSSYVSS